jgi:hypothetical protein
LESGADAKDEFALVGHFEDFCCEGAFDGLGFDEAAAGEDYHV